MNSTVSFKVDFLFKAQDDDAGLARSCCCDIITVRRLLAGCSETSAVFFKNNGSACKLRMSWVKAVSYSGEDVFDESADDLNLQSKEWTSNMKKRVKVKLMLT